METEYRRVLHKWAKSVIPDAKRITGVDFNYGPGISTTYTFSEPTTDVFINYEDTNGRSMTKWIEPEDPEFVTMGELLQKLFALAEQEDLANA